jgi:hypothetical protein
VNVDALHGAARLAGVEEGAVNEVFDCGIEQRVGAHVRRVLAAELEAGGDEALAGRALHRLPPADRSRERDERDALVADHAADLFVIEVQELEHAVGQAGGSKRFGIALGDERRLLRHLEDHAVARKQRGHHRVHGGEPRIVPGRDYEHRAERFAPDEPFEIVFRLDRDIGERRFRDVGHVQGALVKAACELHRSVRDRPAHLPRELFTECGGAFDAPCGHAADDSRALGDRRLAPVFLCARRFL